MTRKADINWYRIRELMRRSITGQALRDDETQAIMAAHQADPKRYAKEHAEVKAEEVERIRSMGR